MSQFSLSFVLLYFSGSPDESDKGWRNTIFVIDGKVRCEEKPRYLETAGSTSRAVWQHILYEYPRDILGLARAAVVQIDLKREIDRRLMFR